MRYQEGDLSPFQPIAVLIQHLHAGSGTVDFADFFLFTERFGQPERAKLLAMASARIGLPEGPLLQQNAPNPFNSGTVISWFQLQPGPWRAGTPVGR